MFYLFRLNYEEFLKKIEEFPESERDKLILEYKFSRKHATDTSEQLLQYVRDVAEKLGKVPTRSDMIGTLYLKKRLGVWNHILEMAGLKEGKVPEEKARIKEFRRVRDKKVLDKKRKERKMEKLKKRQNKINKENRKKSDSDS